MYFSPSTVEELPHGGGGESSSSLSMHSPSSSLSDTLTFVLLRPLEFPFRRNCGRARGGEKEGGGRRAADDDDDDGDEREGRDE